MSVFVRILLRYAAMALVAHGYLTKGDANLIAADPDVAMALEMAIGATMGAASEIWMLVQKRAEKLKRRLRDENWDV